MAGLPFKAAPPRVFVVAAINGGAGSGAVLDVAYAVRAAAAEWVGNDTEVCGVLMHGGGIKSESRDLAVANTISCLDELWHFSRPGGVYPGDKNCRLPESVAKHKTFDHTWFVHAGDEVSVQDYEDCQGKIAEYLFRGTATASSAFFLKARNGCSNEAGGGADEFMRSFAIGVLDESTDPLTQRHIAELSRAVLRHWCGDGTAESPVSNGQPPSSIAPETVQFCERRLGEVGVGFEELLDKANTIYSDARAQRATDYFRKHITEQQAAGKQTPVQILSWIDEQLSFGDSDAPDPQTPEAIAGMVSLQLQQFAGDASQSLGDAILQLADLPQARIGGAVAALSQTFRQLAGLSQRLEAEARRVVEQSHAIRTRISTAAPVTSAAGGPGADQKVATADTVASLLDYAGTRMKADLYRRFAELPSTIAERLSDVRGILDFLRVTLHDLEQLVPKPHIEDLAELPDSTFDVQPLIAPAEVNLQAEFFGESQSLRELLGGDDDSKTALLEAIQTSARHAVIKSRADDDEDDEHAASDADGDQPADPSPPTLADVIAQTRDRLPELGGGRRLLVTTRNEKETARVAKEAARIEGVTPTVLPDGQNATMACFEVSGIPLGNVMTLLTGDRRDLQDMASRLHTRIDVNWE